METVSEATTTTKKLFSSYQDYLTLKYFEWGIFYLTSISTLLSYKWEKTGQETFVQFIVHCEKYLSENGRRNIPSNPCLPGWLNLTEEKEMFTSGKAESRACHLGVCLVLQSPGSSICIPDEDSRAVLTLGGHSGPRASLPDVSKAPWSLFAHQ